MSDDIHALSGAYAVDALDDIERAQFERHLNGCSACRAEVEGLREAANLMAEDSLGHPPLALRGRVLATIETVRPLPPVMTAAPEQVRSTRRRLPALIAAAVALIALGGAVTAAWHPWDQGSSSVTTAQRVEDAPDKEAISHDLVSGGTVTVVRSKKLDQAIISTDGLPSLEEGRTYELWLDHDGTKTRAGLIDGDATHVLLDGDVSTADGVAITLERSGGVDTPQGPLVATLDFDQA